MFKNHNATATFQKQHNQCHLLLAICKRFYFEKFVMSTSLQYLLSIKYIKPLFFNINGSIHI